MTNKAVSTLKQRVRAILDQNVSNTALLSAGDVDTLSLDAIIEETLVTAARAATMEAPRWMLIDGAKSHTATPSFAAVATGLDLKVAKVQLPSDFLRLISFKMSDWDYAVSSVITEEDDRYAIQRSGYAGLMGNPHRPVVAIVHRDGNNGNYMIEAYSSEGDSELDTCLYAPKPAISNSQLAIFPLLEDAIVYYAAHLTAQSVGEEDKKLLAQYYKSLGIEFQNA